MRNLALILAAVAVLVVGFVLATGSDDTSPDASRSAVTTQASTPPATTSTPASTPSTTTEAAPPPAPKAEVVTVEGGKPDGGVQRLAFDKGDTVRFKVASDVADEIHVHGYDLMKDVEAGGSVSFSFKAKFDGKYEVELEGAGVQIASLEIQP